MPAAPDEAEHTPLFERLVNVLTETPAGIAFCFDTSPETTIDTLRHPLFSPGHP